MKTNTYIISCACLCALSSAAHAQSYPARPVRTVVPLSAGGGMDSITRSLSAKLGEAFAQSFVVDNRPGAGSQVALEILSSAAPDGYTLMMMSATTVVHPLLYKSRFDIARDFLPVSQVTAQGYVMVVHPSVPVKTAQEFTQFLKANPDKINYASAGIGSLVHMSAELFKTATGTRMTHVPYKGMGSGYGDLLGGHVQAGFPTYISSQAHIGNGRLRALAVTPAKRIPALPNVPTFAEAGIHGVVVVNWYGLIAPAKTPATIIQRLTTEITKAMHSPDMGKSLLAEGADAVASTPAEFAAHMKAENQQWSRLIKAAGIKGN